jgi:hypothetical protein
MLKVPSLGTGIETSVLEAFTNALPDASRTGPTRGAGCGSRSCHRVHRDGHMRFHKSGSCRVEVTLARCRGPSAGTERMPNKGDVERWS